MTALCVLTSELCLLVSGVPLDGFYSGPTVFIADLSTTISALQLCFALAWVDFQSADKMDQFGATSTHRSIIKFLFIWFDQMDSWSDAEALASLWLDGKVGVLPPVYAAGK